MSRLDGRTFLSTSVEGHVLVAGTAIRLGFGEGELGASAGCNSMGGPYRIDGGVLRMSGLSMTLVGCDDALHAQEDWVAALLTSSPTVTLQEPELTLRSDGNAVTFLDREIASPDRPLTGTRWTGAGAGNAEVVIGGPGWGAVTLGFDATGSVAVFTACEEGTGRYAAGPDTITFEALSYDGAPCADPDLQSVSDAVVAVLGGSPVSYYIEEAELTLESGTSSLYFFADE